MRIQFVTKEEVLEMPREAVLAEAGDSTEGGVLWIDMNHAESEGMELLLQLFDVRPGDLDDCHARTPVAKLHPYEDHHFSAINGLARGNDKRLYFQPLKVFLNAHIIFTILGPTSSALPTAEAHREIDAVRRRIDVEGFRPSTSLELVAALRREMIGTLEELIGSAANQIADFEKRIVRFDPVKVEKLLGELWALRHDLQTIRTSAAQAHQTYVNLIETMTLQEELLPLDIRRLNELRQGFGHLVQTTDLEREYLQEMLELFQTRVATELNRFVRRVTAWGATGLALTVIAGIYGMNFVHMPELAWEWGYPGAIGLMVLVGVGLMTFFRRHGWI